MSTPTATPRTDAALYPMNGVEIVWPDFARTLETELAEARAEAAHYMSVAQKATDDLTRLRADNLTAHQMACAAGLERDRLRADLERFTGHGLLDCHAICDQRDAAIAERDRLRAEVERLKELLRIESASAQHALAAAERAEADSARLDWLLDRSAQTYHSYSNPLGGGNYVQYHKDRAAIDAAMKEGK